MLRAANASKIVGDVKTIGSLLALLVLQRADQYCTNRAIVQSRKYLAVEAYMYLEMDKAGYALTSCLR